FKRGHEMFAVQMLRRGDDHGVDAAIFEQVPVIEVRAGLRCNLLGTLQALGVDIGDACELGIGTRKGFAHQHGAAVARTDDPKPDALVGSQNVGACKRSGKSGGYFADEIAPRMHVGKLLLNALIIRTILALPETAGWPETEKRSPKAPPFRR